jgi:hypothetical protein
MDVPSEADPAQYWVEEALVITNEDNGALVGDIFGAVNAQTKKESYKDPAGNVGEAIPNSLNFDF